jgi:lysophospholipase L1-like esterase
VFLSAALAALSLVSAQPAAPKFEIHDGDRIVWIGNTLVEREQRYGYWETALHAAFPDKQFTLRNLGWSGDTVFGDARAGFDTPAKGFERLVSLTLELKPTVIFVSYGTNESFEGEAGLPKFEKGLEKLLDALKPAKARVVLFSPLPVVEQEAPTQSNANLRNRWMRVYCGSIQVIAERRALVFLNNFEDAKKAFDTFYDHRLKSNVVGMARLTENGIHLTEDGYQMLQTWFLVRGQLPPDYSASTGKYAELRKAIIAKNQLFFYKWRPQNETYLFGFRKHEQGKNAKEVAEFDPLVAKAEDEIETLRKKLKD